MNALVDLEQLTVKLGTYRTGSTTALKDPQLLPLAKMRRKQASQLMVPFDRETAQKRLPPGTYLIMPKIDGEFTLLVYRNGDVCSLNPYGTARAGAPWMLEAAHLLTKAGVKRAILGGELHVRHPGAQRTRVQDVVSAARAPADEAVLNTLYYAAFAIYDLDGQDLTTKPLEQIATLRRILKGGDKAHAIEAHEGDNADVMKRFETWVGEGGEGVVALSTDLGWYKIKPRHSLDVAVVGFSEGTDDRANMLHSLLLAMVRDDGTYHLVGRTGGGFSDDQRRQMLVDLAKRPAESQYAEVNSDRVAYRMITPGLVAEISCLDVITASSDGEPIERMVLEYDEAKGWEGMRRLPLASIISPQFVRLRDDKTASATDVGLGQLARIATLPEPSAAALEHRLPAATVLRRVVGSKELKGKTMVRKLVLWKTNKDTLSDEYPAYVLALTDFSPNRKTPLERDIRVSSSLEQIEAYWQVWHAEQFVKGWVVR